MKLQQIDLVGLEPLQRTLEFIGAGLGRRAPRSWWRGRRVSRALPASSDVADHASRRCRRPRRCRSACRRRAISASITFASASRCASSAEGKLTAVPRPTTGSCSPECGIGRVTIGLSALGERAFCHGQRRCGETCGEHGAPARFAVEQSRFSSISRHLPAISRRPC